LHFLHTNSALSCRSQASSASTTGRNFRHQEPVPFLQRKPAFYRRSIRPATTGGTRSETIEHSLGGPSTCCFSETVTLDGFPCVVSMYERADSLEVAAACLDPAAGILGDSVHFGLDELSALSHDVNHPDILLPHKTRDLANLLLTHFLCFRSSSGVHGEPVLRLSKLSNMSLHKQASGGNIEHLGAGESHSGSQEEAGDFTGDS